MATLTSYPESIATVISTVDHNFRGLLSSPATRRSLQLHCTSKLTIPKSGLFEFFDHSILSSLYWGIETIESAINTNSASEQNTLLANSEKMLQVPAILDEEAATAGIDNRFIVCCSYFHLALIRKLWSDEWQMAMHFLQAVLVSPSCVGTEFAPDLYASLFSYSGTNGGEAAARQQARRYKDCLMFYQVIWGRRAAKVIIKGGRSVFGALAKGIQSQRQSVQRDCLITAAWLGSAVIPSRSLRYSACEILLDEVAAFLHPGTQLDERILACFSVYNYTSGKGKEKLLYFSEGLRESLRRLSGVTWMAEELLNVIDYFLPTKPGVSCVHTQILEIVNIGNGSVTALTFYKGRLYTGFFDGSIKVWDIKEQQSLLLWEVKKHKRSVTCFTVYEPTDSLLSGSTDKTIRVWKNVQKKLECVEVIQVKEPVQKVGACNEKILIVTKSRGIKVCHASRRIQTVCKNKHVTSFAVSQGKIYLGCTDSSMQEIDIEEGNEIEIREPTRSWKMQRTPINSICVYKGWIYCAGDSVEGSNAKDWRRCKQPQISLKMSRRNHVQAMSVAEDFLYLSRSSSPSTVQIFLREKQQSVGKLSAGSRVISLLTANDIILCGTEAGLVKGWIPL